MKLSPPLIVVAALPADRERSNRCIRTSVKGEVRRADNW